jgi:hypothetical protein
LRRPVRGSEVTFGEGEKKCNEKGLPVSEALLVFSGGAGRDRTDDLMNAIFFISKDENLTKAHIRYLEGQGW